MIMLTFHADHAMTMAMADGVPTGNVKLYCITVMIVYLTLAAPRPI